MKSKQAGTDYYVKKGLRKPITVYVSPETHAALMAQATSEERSLQKVVRRILDEHVSKRRKGE